MFCEDTSLSQHYLKPCGDFLGPEKKKIEKRKKEKETPRSRPTKTHTVSWKVLENTRHHTQVGVYTTCWLLHLTMTYSACQKSQDLCSNSSRSLAAFGDLGRHFRVTRKKYIYICKYTHISYKNLFEQFWLTQSYTSAHQLCPHRHQQEDCCEPEQDFVLGVFPGFHVT